MKDLICPICFGNLITRKFNSGSVLSFDCSFGCGYGDFDENNIMIGGRLTYNGRDFSYGHGYLNVTEYTTGKQIIKKLQISLDFRDKDIRNKLNRILKINGQVL